MAKGHTSQKRTQVDRTNSRLVASVAVAAFIVVFSLVASHALWTRMSHQATVIREKEAARNQLEQNIETVGDLQTAYNVFTGTNQNVIGGDPRGGGDRDGDNAKIVLDALPSKYDFPGLTTSLEKLIKNNGSTINSISGTDEEATQSQDQPGMISGPIEIPFELSATGDYQATQNLLTLLQRSIRPIKATTLDLSGTNSQLVLTMTAVTYYQPERTLETGEKVVQ